MFCQKKGLRSLLCGLGQQQREVQSVLDAGSDQNTDDSTPSVVKQELLFKDIESLSKDFKFHRAVIDFDSAFINAELRYAQIEGNRMNS